MDRIAQLEKELQEERRKRFVENQQAIQASRNKFIQANYGLSMSGSDDYYGANIGNYSFYYGYEETYCPVKSHKDENDCYDKNCDRRESCFVARVHDVEIVRYTTTELGDQGTCEENLIAGILKFFYTRQINEGKN